MTRSRNCASAAPAQAVARRQEARLWELRAAVNPARLWRDQGRRGEARDLLTPVYVWFTEEFETVDLTEAKALLDELGETRSRPLPSSSV